MKKISAITAAFAATILAANAAVPFATRTLPAADKGATVKITPRKSAPLRAKAKDVPFIEDFTTPDNLNRVSGWCKSTSATAATTTGL